MRLLLGRDAEVAAWVGRQVGINDFGPCTTIGFMDGEKIIAGVVFNNYRVPGIEATIASVSPRWCSRGTLAAIFGYVFDQVGCRRFTAVTEAKNQHTRKFLRNLGFVEEGTLRYGFPTDDAVVYGMLREECRWLRTRKAEWV